MSIVRVKVTIRKQTRCLSITRQASWNELCELLQTIFQLSISNSCILYYKDNENECIALSTDIELHEILSQEDLKCIRLYDNPSDVLKSSITPDSSLLNSPCSPHQHEYGYEDHPLIGKIHEDHNSDTLGSSSYHSYESLFNMFGRIADQHKQTIQSNSDVADKMSTFASQIVTYYDSVDFDFIKRWLSSVDSTTCSEKNTMDFDKQQHCPPSIYKEHICPLRHHEPSGSFFIDFPVPSTSSKNIDQSYPSLSYDHQYKTDSHIYIKNEHHTSPLPAAYLSHPSNYTYDDPPITIKNEEDTLQTSSNAKSSQRNRFRDSIENLPHSSLTQLPPIMSPLYPQPPSSYSRTLPFGLKGALKEIPLEHHNQPLSMPITPPTTSSVASFHLNPNSSSSSNSAFIHRPHPVYQTPLTPSDARDARRSLKFTVREEKRSLREQKKALKDENNLFKREIKYAKRSNRYRHTEEDRQEGIFYQPITEVAYTTMLEPPQPKTALLGLGRSFSRLSILKGESAHSK
ncbi:hypothetical protein BDF14DRAFT_1827974 [Spinellus fusiger]|nr:hypothetical protein BDF14DRAFT_1827974 [Spinellus fusiger]